MEQQQQNSQGPMQQVPNSNQKMPYFNDTQVSQSILDVHSKTSHNLREVIILDPETGQQTKMLELMPTEYHELLTEDVSTAFGDLVDQSVARTLENVCSMIKSYADSEKTEVIVKDPKTGQDKIIIETIDLSPAYNLVADYHNSMMVSSKMLGQGARTAKSMYVESVEKGTYETREPRRKKFLGLL